MTAPTRCFVLFASIHDVTGAERALRAAGLWCDLVPTPLALSADCGMSLEIREWDVERVLQLTRGTETACRGVYCSKGDVYARRG